MKINTILYSTLAAIIVLSSAYAKPAGNLTDTKQQVPDAEVSLPSGFTGDYLSGQFARSSGDIDSAIRFLREAHRKDPKNTEIAGQLEGLLLLQGQIDEATKLADQINRNTKGDALSGLLVTLRDIKKNDFEAAARTLDGEFEEGSGQLWLPLVTAWLDLGRHKLLKPLTIESLSADVGHAAPLVHYHLALINTQAGFKDAAIDNYKNAIEDPKNPPMRVMESLIGFYERNNKPAALKSMVDTYNEAHPTREEEGAQITSIHDGVAEVLFTMGSIMLGAGVGNDATIYLQLALYMKPDFALAALTLGDAYSDLDKPVKANEIYAMVPQSSRLYSKSLLHTAVNLDRMGKIEEAVAMLDKMSKIKPTESDALVAKGDLFRIHARYADAVEAYTQALKRIPELKTADWPILFARGSCYERLKKWDAAEQDLKQALDLKPDQPDVLNYLGYSWLERGKNIPEARAMLEKAVKARPNDAQIVDSMGWALYLSGDYDGAVAYLEKAVALLPGDPTVNDHLGDVYWRVGRKTEARYQWERSISYTEDTVLKASIERKLKEGLPPPTITNTAAAVTEPASVMP